MQNKRIIINWIKIDAIASLLPFFLMQLFLNLTSIVIEIGEHKSTNLAGLYFWMIILDKIIMTIWITLNRIESRLKLRALVYSLGSLLLIAIMIIFLRLTFDDIRWNT